LFVQAQVAADQVMSGKVPDPTGGGTHYNATTMPKAPVWTSGAKQPLKLGRHTSSSRMCHEARCTEVGRSDGADAGRLGGAWKVQVWALR